MLEEVVLTATDYVEKNNNNTNRSGIKKERDQIERGSIICIGRNRFNCRYNNTIVISLNIYYTTTIE